MNETTARAAPMAIYQVHLGSWMRVPEEQGRPLRHAEIAPRLADHASRVGFTHVELLEPVARHPDPEGLAGLVAALRGRGLGVILDATPPPGAPGRALPALAASWIERYRPDGLRFGGLGALLRPGGAAPGREDLEAVALLRELNDSVHARHPDVLTFAEDATGWPMITRPAAAGGLGFDFAWDLGWARETLGYLGRDPIHRKWNHAALTARGTYEHEAVVLPLSHHEVGPDRGSLLARMHGDRWQRFANLRLLYGFMYTLPGKKLLFMGGEFAQWAAWNPDGSLDWHVLEDPAHRQIEHLVGELNALYQRVPSLHALDCDARGFGWIDASDADHSVLVYERHAAAGAGVGGSVVVVLNFTPVPRQNYRIGVPEEGVWEEILNTDAALFGGSGHGNLGGVETAPVPWHGRAWSLNLTLPPLGALLLGRRA